jgi:hypothetical protein
VHHGSGNSKKLGSVAKKFWPQLVELESRLPPQYLVARLVVSPFSDKETGL